MVFSKFQTLHELPVPFEAKLQFFPDTSVSKCGCRDSRLRLRVEERMFFPKFGKFSPFARLLSDGGTDGQATTLSFPPISSRLSPLSAAGSTTTRSRPFPARKKAPQKVIYLLIGVSSVMAKSAF